MPVRKTQVHPVAVIPSASTQAPATSDSTLIAPLLVIHGNYSIERLLALEEYSRTTSYWHVLWVLLSTPLIPVAIILACQLPQLSPPEGGLQANWVYFVVSGVSAAIAGECSFIITRVLLPELAPALARRNMVPYDLFVGVVYVVVMVALATVWGFPIPFTPIVINPISSIITTTGFHLIVRSVVNQSSDLQRRMKSLSNHMTVLSLAGIVYPAYVALLINVGKHNPQYQPLITFIPPAMSLALRKFAAQAVREWEDLIPVHGVFPVEFFSSLYQTISLQASNSPLTTATIISLDMASTVRNQWNLYQHTKSLQLLLRARHSEQLLPTVVSACEDVASLQATSVAEFQRLRSIRLYSAAPSNHVSIERQQRLERIDNANVFSSPKGSSEAVQSRLTSRRRATLMQSVRSKVTLARKATVRAPLSTDTPSVPVQGAARGIHSAVVVETTAMLFHTEMMLLAEYRECMIPLFFSIIMVIVWLYPNAAYYNFTRSINSTDDLFHVLQSLAVLFVLELVSFVVLNVVLWKRLRFSPLHQLSFVLENQASIIQANILFALFVTIGFNMVHSGVDFSFQFMWLRSQGS